MAQMAQLFVLMRFQGMQRTRLFDFSVRKVNLAVICLNLKPQNNE